MVVVATSLVARAHATRVVVTTAAVLYALVVAVSRVVAGAHDASDVAGGLFVGAGSALLVALIVSPAAPDPRTRAAGR
ncbi:MAG TPA: phosphatase PAP2 family protein [Acidimicrobiia bacterium]|nr:phosphatase PAP2 family protein [Acidimicrobiia bacterium]